VANKLSEATEILCPEKQQLFKIVTLSANTVADCVNDLVGDVQCQLEDFVAYSTETDNSIDIRSTAQFDVFVQGVNEEELLELVPMKQ